MTKSLHRKIFLGLLDKKLRFDLSEIYGVLTSKEFGSFSKLIISSIVGASPLFIVVSGFIGEFSVGFVGLLLEIIYKESRPLGGEGGLGGC